MSKLKRFYELLITTLFGAIPTLFLGPKLRNVIYRTIFARLGKSVYIQDGVELVNAYCAEIGDGVHIFRGVRFNAAGENNHIRLESGVALERNVDIGCLDHTNITIKKDTFIGSDVCITGPGDIVVGERCLIAAHCGIYANNHRFHNIEEPITAQGISRKGIVIEDDCWLGHAVTVLDGVTIGKGSVIGAGAVVTKDIPPYSVAVGVPAKVIKNRLVDGEPNQGIKFSDLVKQSLTTSN